MKLIRFLYENKPRYGFIEKKMVYEFAENPSQSDKPVSAYYPKEKVRLLAPCVPSKIVGVGLNYDDHIKELGLPKPEVPLLFLKPSTCVIGPDDPICLPSMSDQVDYEAELAVVMGKPARNLSVDQVEKHIMGYTCLNDVTARDLQKKDGQFTRSKSFNTFCPIGPWIETECDPSHLKVEAYLNGKLRQSSNTNQLIFNVKELISFISQVMTLLPGDVIATGTPFGVGPMQAGDTIEIRIEGIGSLSNPVVDNSHVG